MEHKEIFNDLVIVMDTLRAECPWDKKQTIQTLSNLTVEEVYELTEAIALEDWDNLKEELGDVLKSIHRRMISEGYEIVDGVIRKV